MFLLDTDVIIDYLKQKKPGSLMVAQILENELFISIVTWIELKYGIRKSINQNKHLKELNNFLAKYAVTIIPIDLSIATVFVELELSLEGKGVKLADFDLLIASTAIANKLKLITRNTKHFSRIKNLSLSV